MEQCLKEYNADIAKALPTQKYLSGIAALHTDVGDWNINLQKPAAVNDFELNN